MKFTQMLYLSQIGWFCFPKIHRIWFTGKIGHSTSQASVLIPFTQVISHPKKPMISTSPLIILTSLFSNTSFLQVQQAQYFYISIHLNTSHQSHDPIIFPSFSRLPRHAKRQHRVHVIEERMPRACRVASGIDWQAQNIFWGFQLHPFGQDFATIHSNIWHQF